MGLLLSALANCGSRKPDGTPNASGQVFLYSAGTIAACPGYSDAACTIPITTVGGAIALDAAGKRTIYMKAPADVVVADSSGTPVDSIPAFNQHRAELIEIEHPGYTGALTDPGTGLVSQALGGKTSLQAILQSAYASVGPNFQRLESSGATPRNWNDWATGLGVSVTDFGAKCDGLTDDTVAVQKAIDEVKRLKGGKVLFPPGTCLFGTFGTGFSVTQSGTMLQGAGHGVTVLKNMSATVSAVSFTGADSIALAGMTISAASACSGTAITVTTANGVRIADVYVDTYASCLVTSGVDLMAIDQNCVFIANGSVATDRGIKATNTTEVTLLGGYFSGTDYGIELLGTSGFWLVAGAAMFGSTAGVRFDAALSGTGFDFIGGRFVSGKFSFGAAAEPGNFYQSGLGVEGATTGILSGATGTPDRSKGELLRFEGTTTGSAYIIAAPTPTTAKLGTRLILQFYNHAGGAVTGWTMNATYKLSAAIPTTDAHVISVTLEWDGANWREIARADTAV